MSDTVHQPGSPDEPKPDLTVIIPTYEMAESTQKAIESVWSQASSKLRLHIIVVDDASATPFHLSATPPQHCRIELIRHTYNQGAAAARGTGAKAATTRWVAYLDADDTFTPATLAERFAFARTIQSELPETPTFVCAGWKEGLSLSNPTRIPNPASSLEELCSGCWYCPGSTLIVQKRWLTSSPGLPDKSLRRLEDFDWGIRLGLAGGRIEVWPSAAAHIRPSNITNTAAVDRAAKAILDTYAELRRTAPKAYHNIAAYLALERSVIAWREGDARKAALLALRSLRHRPRTKIHLSPGWTFK